jgi:hypothetical protein
MSSFTRKIQRQVSPSRAGIVTRNSKGERTGFIPNGPRKKFFGGRGSKLGVKNPKDRALIARRARDAKWGRSA